MTRRIAGAWVALVFVLSFAAAWLPLSSSDQNRALPNAAPSWTAPLGSDELGRDRCVRLLHATRVSLLLAPAAALLATSLAALVGLAAAWSSGWLERALGAAIDLFLSIPWFFLYVAVRAMLPLNTSAEASLAITFALMGLLGWAQGARIVRAGARQLRDSGFVLQARAAGVSPARILLRQILPNLRPVLIAQFWVAVPVFIVAEASLGLLGLGVSEPLPTWGGLLRDLESVRAPLAAPWLLAPLATIVSVVFALQLSCSREERPS